jgi:glyoxylase-like metal-dependent hydrolase (beta-lactamase superfamily II)
MTGDGNWTWLLRGRTPTLIDAGVGEGAHLDALALALAVDGTPLAQVVVTHGHSDHASGAAAIAARFPVTRFLKMPWPERDARWGVTWAPLRDGDIVVAGDTALTVVHTPGHAPDHLCLWHEPTGSVFGGDLAIRDTTVWIPSSAHGDLRAYLQSLERILALHPSRIFPAHGPVIDDPGSLLRAYVAHRADREREILAALRAGERTAAAIAAKIYSTLHQSLLPRAEETVSAHLEKLEREGRARCTDNAWHIIDT